MAAVRGVSRQLTTQRTNQHTHRKARPEMTTYTNPDTNAAHRTYNSETGEYDDGCGRGDTPETIAARTAALIDAGWTTDPAPTTRRAAIGDRVTVNAFLPSAAQYNSANDIDPGTPVPATVFRADDGVDWYSVHYPDGTQGNPSHSDTLSISDASDALTPDEALTPEEQADLEPRPETVADSQNTPREATEAPQTPADPIEAWEARLSDSEAFLDAAWAAADAAADAAAACSEYERTTAWPNGHPGRVGNQPGDGYSEDTMGAGTVTFRRTIIRREWITQEMTVDVGVGEDAWEVMHEAYDWEDLDVTDSDEEEEDDYGPEVYDSDREEWAGMPDTRTRPAALIRLALNSDTSYRGIRDAILQTARDHGAPLTNTHTASLSASISRTTPDGRAWQAPTGERLENVTVTAWEADQLADRTTADAYNVANRLFTANGHAARIAWGTLATVVSQQWTVNA